MLRKPYTFSAFTLAEVLITLGIIGVVAAIILPSLMNKTNDKETVTALKKVYSTLSSAYNLAVQDNGIVDSWTIGADWSAAGAQNISNYLTPYLNVTNDCGTVGTSCAPNFKYKLLSGSDWINFTSTTSEAKVDLANGAILYFSAYRITNFFGLIYVDINGFSKPNQCGVDTFLFSITKNGIIPEGKPSGSLYPFAGNCRDKTTQTGAGCTAWVIYNENMDYLKDNCTTLSWGGPTTCN